MYLDIIEEVCGKDNINISSIEKNTDVMIAIKLQVCNANEFSLHFDSHMNI